jgi:hypothetical protein
MAPLTPARIFLLRGESLGKWLVAREPQGMAQHKQRFSLQIPGLLWYELSRTPVISLLDGPQIVSPRVLSQPRSS